MNKKVNTILFILGATLFNALIAIICFILLTILYVRLLMNLLPEQTSSWSFTFIFIISIVVSFIAYRFLMKYLIKKVDVEKYFDPIFVRRNIRKPGSWEESYKAKFVFGTILVCINGRKLRFWLLVHGYKCKRQLTKSIFF